MFFGYANCPDICPVTLAVLAEAERLVGEGSFQTGLVSVDPERDTPDVLDAYVGTFSPRFVAATGAPHAVQKFAGSVGAAFRKAPATGSELRIPGRSHRLHRRGGPRSTLGLATFARRSRPPASRG